MCPIRHYVTHLQSALDGTEFDYGEIVTTHEDRPVWVAYDTKALRRAVKRQALGARAPDMWRYREFLPFAGDPVSLGEVMTPLLACPRLGAKLGLDQLYIKDESRLPTGSFKARGMAVAITMARALGIKHVALPSAGNAGGAAAAYAARAQLQCTVVMPADTPVVNRLESVLFGANVYLVDGLISDCGAVVREGVERKGWFDLSTLREPYRLEGKKTMGFELAEQLGWRVPNAIFYPTGGGTGLIGMWKAFQELQQVGWLAEGVFPRLYACQSSGCAPIVTAYDGGARHAEPAENPATIASGIRVPAAIGDFMILDAVRASGGAALAAEEARLGEWMRLACETEGVSLCPEAAACIGALAEARRRRAIKSDELVVVFNTGAVQKYVEAMETPLPRIDPAAIDWNAVR